jgi:ribonuclease/clavin/mitogillin
MDVSRFAVPVPSAPHGTTNTYLIGRKHAILVDPAARSSDLDTAVADRTIDHIAVTHHHPDHVGAVRAYAEETGATVWARQGREQSFTAATDTPPDRTFCEGTVLETDGGDIRVLEMPGHTPEHVAYVVDSGTQLRFLVGDLTMASSSVVVGAPEGDMRAYLGSLRRVYTSDPDVLHPGHGPVIDDPRTRIEELIDHRLDREQRVQSAVESGASTVSDITDAAYEKDVSAVRALAEATVEAHLEKLVVEGRVEWDGEHASVLE